MGLLSSFYRCKQQCSAFSNSSFLYPKAYHANHGPSFVSLNHFLPPQSMKSHVEWTAIHEEMDINREQFIRIQKGNVIRRKMTPMLRRYRKYLTSKHVVTLHAPDHWNTQVLTILWHIHRKGIFYRTFVLSLNPKARQPLLAKCEQPSKSSLCPPFLLCLIFIYFSDHFCVLNFLSLCI